MVNMTLRNSALTLAALALAACATTSAPVPAQAKTNPDFQRFYAQLRKEAAQKGHSPAMLDAAFSGTIAPVPQVLQSEKSQPESVRTFAEYTGSMLTSTRIMRGRANLAAHAQDLSATAARTGVSASVVVALWGIESRFGEVQGSHPVIPALATLAWKSHRPDYFRKETFAALKVVEQTGKEPDKLLGSWAGAMGQCQFMPSSWLAYGADGDGDGIADIWSNEADVFASAATYLSKRGWQSGQAWRYTLPTTFKAEGLDLNSRGLSPQHPLSYWKKRGFKAPANLPASTKLRYYKPQEDAPAHLLGPNFSVILSWNNSSYFAWSVLALADSLETE